MLFAVNSFLNEKNVQSWDGDFQLAANIRRLCHAIPVLKRLDSVSRNLSSFREIILPTILITLIRAALLEKGAQYICEKYRPTSACAVRAGWRETKLFVVFRLSVCHRRAFYITIPSRVWRNGFHGFIIRWWHAWCRLGQKKRNTFILL